MVEEGSPLGDRTHGGWVGEPVNPAADGGPGSRDDNSRSVTEQLLSSVTWTTLQIDTGTQLTREVREMR